MNSYGCGVRASCLYMKIYCDLCLGICSQRLCVMNALFGAWLILNDLCYIWLIHRAVGVENSDGISCVE